MRGLILRLAMRDQYYVIGDPISHSLSPDIYTVLFRKYSVDADYGRERVTARTLPDFIGSLREKNVRGFNVTMPLKKDVEAYLKYRDPAALFGVNTVLVRPDGLYGYSTDAAGFRKSLSRHGREYDGNRVVFLGCGGAAKALIHDAADQNASHITIINRTASKADAFSDWPQVSIGSFDDLEDACRSCDILINATPLGMHGVAAQFQDLSFLGALPRRAFVADLIYNPTETAFLKEAKRTGHECMNGLGMLIWQGILAFEKYTGIQADDAAADEIRCSLETSFLRGTGESVR